MNTEIQNLSLFCIGSALLWITLDGSFVRYVKPSMEPYLLISAAVILVLSVVSMARHVQVAGPGADEPHDDAQHGHQHGGGRLLWLLVLPVLVVFFLKPPALAPSGDEAPANVAASAPAQFPALPPGDPLAWRSTRSCSAPPSRTAADCPGGRSRKVRASAAQQRIIT